jgi:hypothetical protein
MSGVKVSGGGEFILPSSYVGSHIYISGRFHDALYMCTRLGCPPFFITFTVNLKWPEIIEAILETSPTSTYIKSVQVEVG